MKKISTTLQKMIEENKREILSNQNTLSDIEKKVDIKIIAKEQKAAARYDRLPIK